jgi:hypothetical protein
VNVSFSSFLCAKEKDRLKGFALIRRSLGVARDDSVGGVPDRYLSPVRGVKKHLFARKVAKSLLM